MTVGNRGAASLATRATPPKPCHLRRGGGLVDEDQLLRLKIGLGVEPGLAAAQDIGALLLGGVRRLFLNVTPRLSRKYQIVDGTT